MATSMILRNPSTQADVKPKPSPRTAPPKVDNARFDTAVSADLASPP